MAIEPLRPDKSVNAERSTRFFQAAYADLFNPGDKVLDVGCGNGIFLELLRERGVKAMGVDSSVDALAACLERGLDIYPTDAFSFLSKNSNLFNGIFASHFIEHFNPRDALRFFELSFKALKPGGLIAIITPNTADLMVMTQWFWLDPTHVRPYPMELVKSMLSQARFTVESAGEDRRTAAIRGVRQRVIDGVRRITTLGLAGRGDVFVTGRKSDA